MRRHREAGRRVLTTGMVSVNRRLSIAFGWCTRPGTLPNVCPKRRTPRCARLSGRPGRWRRAEQLIRNRRLDKEWPGIAATILEGLDEMLCVVRLGLPKDLRRSLACTNIIENMNGTIRQVTRNVKRWRDGSMALRWTAAGMMEAKKGFRRLMAYKQLPTLKAALLAHQAAHSATATNDSGLACTGEAA